MHVQNIPAPRTVPYDNGTACPLVGFLEVSEPSIQRQTYEVAAWFRDFELRPGIFPVYKYPHTLRCDVPATIIDACLVSLFCGIAYGEDASGKSEIGRDEPYAVSVRHDDWMFRGESYSKLFARIGYTFHPIN